MTARSNRPRSPGRILREDFLPRLPEPLREQEVLAKRLGMSRRRLNEILNDRRPVSPESAARLGKAMGTGAEFWLEAQLEHDLERMRRSRLVEKEARGVEPLLPPLESPAPRPIFQVERGAVLPPIVHLGSALSETRPLAEGALKTRLSYYEEFLQERGLLRAADRFARVRSQIDDLRPGTLGDETVRAAPRRILAAEVA